MCWTPGSTCGFLQFPVGPAAGRGHCAADSDGRSLFLEARRKRDGREQEADGDNEPLKSEALHDAALYRPQPLEPREPQNPGTPLDQPGLAHSRARRYSCGTMRHPVIERSSPAGNTRAEPGMPRAGDTTRMRPILRTLLAIVAFSAVSEAVSAQTPPPAATVLTLEAAFTRATEANPTLAAARLRRSVIWPGVTWPRSD